MEKKRVVFYGRVSTQSDEQLSALGNQMTWYDQLLALHPEWVVVGKYEDAGITGTSVRRRKGFRQMLDDGILFHRYDMIITRETKRFARNTVDALSYVRLLKQNGIEVYFVSDAIRTLSDNDGELRLSIMATIAQEESRKTSENVLAGQRISRQKGILRGTGNILGYRRVGRNRYEVDWEQAQTVRKIYRWYLGGDGIRAIKGKLEAEGCRTASGNSCWQLQTISNVLKNPFYTGKQRQLSRVSDGYLTQRRVKNSPEKIEYIQGDYEPIISAEMFAQAGRIREGRRRGKAGKGRKGAKSVWCGKYLCGCGCGMVRKAASGGEFMFACHRRYEVFACQRRYEAGRARDGGMDSSMDSSMGSCRLKTVMEWKLDMIAHYVICDVWKGKDEDVRQASAIIEACRQEGNRACLRENRGISRKIGQMEKRKQGLLEMRADGEITKEEYREKRKACEEEISRLRLLLEDGRDVLDEGKTGEKEKFPGNENYSESEKISTVNEHSEKSIEIKEALNRITGFSQPKLNREIVNGFIRRVVHVSDHEFELYLNTGERWDGRIKKIEEKAIGYKINDKILGYPEPERQEKIPCVKLKSIKLTYEDAKQYRMQSGRRVMKNIWEDLTVHIYLCYNAGGFTVQERNM